MKKKTNAGNVKINVFDCDRFRHVFDSAHVYTFNCYRRKIHLEVEKN